jgi:PAS domain S-box-containing protein
VDNNLSDEVLLLEIVAWWKWDIPTGALSWSDEVYRILGFDKDNFHPTCQGWRDLIYRDDLVLFDAAIDDCLRCRRPFDCELGIVRPDGAGRTLHVRGLVIFDEAGNPLRIIGTAQDITEKKQAETGLHELGAIVKSSEDAILAKTLNGIITRWNRGAEKIYGYTESEVIGKSTSILVPEGHHNEVPELLRRVARGESVAHYETVRRCKDGREIQVCLTISPIYDLSGRITGASTVARDITERNRIQQRLRESEERSQPPSKSFQCISCQSTREK